MRRPRGTPWEPKQWRAYYVDNGEGGELVLKELFPARATETKKQILSSRDPHTSLAASMATGPAWYYREFIAGSDSARQKLIEHLSAEVERHAQANRMVLKEGASHVWADILLKKHIGAQITDRRAAEILGLKTHSEYQRKYKPNEDGPMMWIKSWASQSRR